MLYKKVLLVLFYFFAVIEFTYAGLPWSSIPKKYKVKQDYFLISTKTPPAMLYVTDSQGHRTGINPSFLNKIDQYGILEDQNGFLAEIPISSSEQQNNGDPNNNFASQPRTPCLVTILDGGNQTYTLNLVGITQGVQRLTIKDLPLGKPADPLGQHVFALIQPKVIKQINVTVNAETNNFAVTRIVKSSDLLNDVNTACQLNLISPGGICSDLQTKANAVLKDAGQNDTKSEIHHIQVFLSALQSEGKNHVQDPAFTILQEEANALLQNIQ